jgi:hypothetical protein
MGMHTDISVSQRLRGSHLRRLFLGHQDIYCVDYLLNSAYKLWDTSIIMPGVSSTATPCVEIKIAHVCDALSKRDLHKRKAHMQAWRTHERDAPWLQRLPLQRELASEHSDKRSIAKPCDGEAVRCSRQAVAQIRDIAAHLSCELLGQVGVVEVLMHGSQIMIRQLLPTESNSHPPAHPPAMGGHTASTSASFKACVARCSGAM